MSCDFLSSAFWFLIESKLRLTFTVILIIDSVLKYMPIYHLWKQDNLKSSSLIIQNNYQEPPIHIRGQIAITNLYIT